jgi:conjugative transfer signal peptidase TraF
MPDHLAASGKETCWSWLAPRRRALWDGLATMLAVGTCATLFHPPRPLLVWNASASVPIGLYLITPANSLARGDMVLARLPDRARALAATRGYVPTHVPVIKRIGALAGDRVCAQGLWLFARGRRTALRFARDAEGRRLSWWHGCGPLARADVLLLGQDRRSYDGRYFGPVARKNVIGRARLVWPW